MAKQRLGNQLEHTYNSSVDAGFSSGDLPEAMDDRDG